MRSSQRLVYFLAAVLLMSALLACSTTRISSSWKDPSYQGPPHKVMVIGMAKEPTNRRVFEDTFVTQIKARGTDAVASYTLLTGKLTENHDAIVAALKQQGADSVLITRLLRVETETSYMPGSLDPMPVGYRGWSYHYRSSYDFMYTPGYLMEEEYAIVETSLYDVTFDKLIWSAKSKTTIKGTDHELIRSVIQALTDQMTRQQVLRPAAAAN